MRIQKALIDDTISVKKAGLLLYSMQLALQNVKQVTFGQAKAEEPVRETVSMEEALSNQQSAISQDQDQTQRPTTETLRHGEEDLPLMNADKRRSLELEEENQGLPRIAADDRGVEYVRKQVEWRPTPEMYRMDTREGREAYEASLRTKIGTRGNTAEGGGATRAS